MQVKPPGRTLGKVLAEFASGEGQEGGGGLFASSRMRKIEYGLTI
jgi:hypothetical protein